MHLSTALRFLANFQRDGRAVYNDNQGSRPNYPSTEQVLGFQRRAYNDANHTIWVSEQPDLHILSYASTENSVNRLAAR